MMVDLPTPEFPNINDCLFFNFSFSLSIPILNFAETEIQQKPNFLYSLLIIFNLSFSFVSSKSILLNNIIGFIL